jgi:hypothetical protein
MGWIKRNLFFVVGGVVALLALGGSGFFIWQGWAANSEASEKLNEIYGKLQELAQSPLQPGNKQVDNTKAARDQEKEILDWMTQARKYFQPIAAIPAATNVSSAAYAEGLRQTIDALQKEADNASVNLPPKYDFSFSAQRSRVVFAAGSLEPLAVQLGEVKTISEILFAARVNNLDSIQRVRVSEDDTSGLQSDYIEQRPITNELAIITPYVVTFRTFTPELARVISGFASSPNPFIVKSVLVQPASAVGAPGAPGGEMAPNPYGNPYGNPNPHIRYGMPNPEQQPQPGQPQPGMAPGRGGLQTALKEQLLRITLEVEIVKLLPKS